MSTTWRDRYLRSRYMVQKTIRDYSEKPALRAYLEILLTLTAISLFGVFAIRPTIKTIGLLIREIDAKEKTLQVMNEKISNLKTAKELYTRERDKILLVDEAIPAQPKPDGLTLQVEELAKKDGVFINNMTVEDTKILGVALPDDDASLALTLGVSGEYTNLIRFASDIENLRRPVKYDGIMLSANQTKGKDILFMSLQNLLTPYGNSK